MSAPKLGGDSLDGLRSDASGAIEMSAGMPESDARRIIRDSAQTLYRMEVRRQSMAEALPADWQDAARHMGEELRRVQHALVQLYQDWPS